MTWTRFTPEERASIVAAADADPRKLADTLRAR
jgi:hypothetical protein